MIRYFLDLYRARKKRIAAERHEEMRRMSDDFGFGPYLRYGEDRWGKPDQPAQRRPQ